MFNAKWEQGQSCLAYLINKKKRNILLLNKISFKTTKMAFKNY